MAEKTIFDLLEQLDLKKVMKLAEQVDLKQVMDTLGNLDPNQLTMIINQLNGTTNAAKEPPPINADFYDIAALLTAEEQAKLAQIAPFMNTEVYPIINNYWDKGAFPHELVPKFAHLIKTLLGDHTYQYPPHSPIFAGALIAELARFEPSITTFFGVHWGLSMGSIAMFGSDEQKAKWLPVMQKFEKIGSWALTEPEIGSATAVGLETTAKQEGDNWTINGQKKWSGNASFADVNVIFAKDIKDGQIKAFLVERDTPGYIVKKLQGKIAKRVVDNVLITLDNCQIAEANRLPGVTSFKKIAHQLKFARTSVAWEAMGVARGAYEIALKYGHERHQFNRSIASFQLIQNMLVQMLGNVTAMQTMLLRLSQLEATQGEVSHEQASLAKLFCCEKMRETVSIARSLLGGNGILLEYHVARFFADAEAVYSYEGTHEMNTLIVGRAITGYSAFV